MTMKYLIICSLMLQASSAFSFRKNPRRGACSNLHCRQTRQPPMASAMFPTHPRKTSLDMVNAPIQFFADSYSNSLANHPFATKGVTGFFLCGLSDVIAQVRSFERPFYENETDLTVKPKIDKGRLARFSIKGFFGTSIWSVWYDFSEQVFNSKAVIAILASTNILNPNDAVVTGARILMLILTEQFVTCPLIYGFWEIPVSTLMNGAPVSRIPYEIKDKLGSMLIENAKVWTWFNLLIYNVPVQYRAGISNIGDVLWQSIVSDFSASCGSSDECVIAEMPLLANENDPATELV